MSKTLRLTTLAGLAAVLSACGGGGGSSSETGAATNASTVTATAEGYEVSSGMAQKGPLGRGSVVTVNELINTTLAPNGKSYTFETVDDFGTFKPSSVFSSPYLETTAQGYFFNELTGERGKDWVVLRGLSMLGGTDGDKAVNVNVMTAFTKERIRTLVNGPAKLTFAAARAQAQRELLAALFIHNSSDIFTGMTSAGVTAPGNFMELDLAQTRPADQILAMVSGLVTYAGQSGGGFNALLNRVSLDLADDGVLNNSIKASPGVPTEWAAAQKLTPFGRIAGNLNSYYALKSPYTSTDLAQWSDSSGGVDRVIDRYKFALVDAPLNKESVSPAYVAGSEDAGACVSASAGKLYRNGVAQTAPVLVVKGDRLSLGLTPYAAQTSAAFVQRDPLNTSTKTCPTSASANALRLMKFSVTGVVAGADLLPMPDRYLGANMPYNVDWSPTPIYTDLVRQARCFGTVSAPWGECAVPVGADGWPTGDFGLFLMTGPWLYGTYKLSFTGQATVGMNGTGNTVLANKVYDPVKNRTTLDVIRQPGAQHMALTFTGTGSGIKDLKVMRPGYDPDTAPLYTKEFLSHIARFRVLRFMEWLDTNTTQVQTWAQRTTRTTRYTTATNAHTGEPWENIIELANVSGKDIWINIPVRADDDYVLQLAKLLKNTLNANSKIYVEYSNELWNGGFVQWSINRDLASAEVNTNPASNLAWDGNKDTTMLGMRRVARRLKEISDIFRGVFGDANMMTRVRPVLAGQIVQPVVTGYGLEFIDNVYGPPSRYFYAIAGAPYYNLGAKQTVDGLSVDDVLAAMTTTVGSMTKDAALEKNIAQSRWYGLPLLAYEGGPDTFGGGSIAAKKAASLDTRMTGLCTNYLANWYAAGGETMMWFTAGASNWDTQYGTWGLTNDIAVTNTPKIKCMDQALATPLPQPKGRNMIPGTFNGQTYVGGKDAPYAAAWDNSTRYLHPGSYLDYVVVAPASGTYSLILNTDANQTGNQLDVSVNGSLVAPLFELKNTGWGKYADNTPIPVMLNKGFNVVRVRTRVETSGFTLMAVTVK